MQVEFVASAFTVRDFPRESIPEVVLAGRSNVGKSSLINRLANVKGIARTSSTPGKTRSINFYKFDRTFFLVDLPGFGYARVDKGATIEWKRLIENYFRDRSSVSLVIHLVDSRIPPTKLDMALTDWMEFLEAPRLIVATKADKLSGNKKAAQQRAISNAFGGKPVVLASAVTGIGCKEIWKRVVECVQASMTRR